MVKVIIPLIISLTAIAIVVYLVFSRKHGNWDDMSADEKRKKKLMIFSGIAVFFTAIAAALSFNKKDHSAGDNNLA
jgi:Na+/H+ antiporter NhaD/arsenite permease-like protein